MKENLNIIAGLREMDRLAVLLQLNKRKYVDANLLISMERRDLDYASYDNERIHNKYVPY